MGKVNAYAVTEAKTLLKPFLIERRALGPHDVEIDIKYCGVCHSDIHLARDEWGGSIFPLVPGHEIVGVVGKIGSAVSQYKIGDKVGVGCFVDSCRTCSSCQEGLEQYCELGMNQTYNNKERDGSPTYGGYSTQIVVDENYVLRIPENLPLEEVAPLLCAGITTYSPLRYWNVKPGDKVAVIGLGGLGHIAVKIATAMGAEVFVLSTSGAKKNDAIRFGAKQFIQISDDILQKYANYFDFMLNTAAGNIDLGNYLGLLNRDETMVILGVPEKQLALSSFAFIMQRRHLAGSLIGGINETQEMLDFCSKHGITADIELIPIEKINEAYDRVVNGDVRYRFVIDVES